MQESRQLEPSGLLSDLSEHGPQGKKGHRADGRERGPGGVCTEVVCICTLTVHVRVHACVWDVETRGGSGKRLHCFGLGARVLWVMQITFLTLVKSQVIPCASAAPLWWP